MQISTALEAMRVRSASLAEAQVVVDEAVLGEAAFALLGLLAADAGPHAAAAMQPRHRSIARHAGHARPVEDRESAGAA